MNATDTIQLQKIANESSLRTNPPKQLSVVEASKYIGISQRYLRSLIAERRIRVVRIGNRVILRLVDVDRWIEQHTEGSVL